MTEEQQKEIDSKPSDDISESKDEAEKSFLKELDEAETVSTSAAKPSSEAPKGEKTKSKFSSMVDSLSSKPKRKREIDPILGVSLVILILASAVVLGNTVYGQFIEKQSGSTVEYGDTVDVKYTGSFYDFYGNDDAIVFDTNVEDVDKDMKDHPEKHSWGYTTKTTYSDLSFIVGGTTVLKKFGSSTVGYKVGDTIKVPVERSEGYELPDASMGELVDVQIPSRTMKMTSSEFSSLYGYSAPTAFQELYIKFSEETKDICPFGCNYKVANVDGKVEVTNLFVVDTEYKMFGMDNAKIVFEQDQLGNGFVLKYKLTTDDVPVKGKMIKLVVFHDNAWVLGYPFVEKDGDQSKLMYKIGETLGMDLYFTIEITNIKKA